MKWEEIPAPVWAAFIAFASAQLVVLWQTFSHARTARKQREHDTKERKAQRDHDDTEREKQRTLDESARRVQGEHDARERDALRRHDLERDGQRYENETRVAEARREHEAAEAEKRRAHERRSEEIQGGRMAVVSFYRAVEEFAFATSRFMVRNDPTRSRDRMGEVNAAAGLMIEVRCHAVLLPNALRTSADALVGCSNDMFYKRRSVVLADLGEGEHSTMSLDKLEANESQALTAWIRERKAFDSAARAWLDDHPEVDRF